MRAIDMTIDILFHELIMTCKTCVCKYSCVHTCICKYASQTESKTKELFLYCYKSSHSAGSACSYTHAQCHACPPNVLPASILIFYNMHACMRRRCHRHQWSIDQMIYICIYCVCIMHTQYNMHTCSTYVHIYIIILVQAFGGTPQVFM